MTERIKLTEDDVHIVQAYEGLHIRFMSLEGDEIIWDMKDAEKLKAQILWDHDNAQKHDNAVMENCILSDFKTEFESFCTMNDVSDLEQLDKEFNKLKDEAKSHEDFKQLAIFQVKNLKEKIERVRNLHKTHPLPNWFEDLINEALKDK